MDRELRAAARGGGVYLLGGLLSTLGNLLAAVVLARFLGAGAYGQYRVGVVLVQLLGRTCDLGLKSSALRFVPLAAREGDVGRLRGILRVSCGAPLVVGAAVGLALLLAAAPLAERLLDDRGLAGALRLLALGVPLTALVVAGEAAIRSLGRIDLAVFGHDVVFHGARLVLTAAVLLLGFGIWGAVAAHVVALTLAALTVVGLLLRVVPLLGRRPASVYPLRQIRDHSLPVYVMQLLGVFGGRLEALILGFLGMTAGVGLFAVALHLARLAVLPFESLVNVTLPLLSEAWVQGGAGRLAPLYRTLTRWALMVTLPPVLAVALFAEPLLAIFGEDFAAARLATVILVLGPLVNAGTGVSGGILTMTGRARINALAGALYLAATIGFDVLLIPRWGATGAAMAMVAASAVLNGVRLVAVGLLLRLWPYDRSFAKPLAASAVAAAAAWAVRGSLAPAAPLAEAAVGIAVLAGTYAASLLALGLSAEDRMILERIVARLRRRGGR